MWIPASTKEIEEAARRGDLEETHTFDAKASLPTPRKNRDVAVDVCAMTVDGGSLVYGLGEDEHSRLTTLSPITLTGAPERVAQIVETSVHEPPFIRVQALPLKTDTAKGYLLVVVPQSPRAPHQVISGGDMRYYGRGAKGNRVLSEPEVADLYARRQSWEVDREELLEAELARLPDPDPRLGYVVAFARPVVPDDSMVERISSDGRQLLEILLKGAHSWGDVRADRSGRGYEPDLRRATNVWRRGADGWTITTSYEREERQPKYEAIIDLDFDGTAHFFCGRIADTLQSGQKVLFDTILAGNLASFFSAMGAFYATAGYVGYVDVGMAVTLIEGAAPYGAAFYGDNLFSGPMPRRTDRVTATELTDDAKRIVLRLVSRLLATVRGTSYSPFEGSEVDVKSREALE